jgi:hypothetical protein
MVAAKARSVALGGDDLALELGVVAARRGERAAGEQDGRQQQRGDAGHDDSGPRGSK